MATTPKVRITEQPKTGQVKHVYMIYQYKYFRILPSL